MMVLRKFVMLSALGGRRGCKRLCVLAAILVLVVFFALALTWLVAHGVHAARHVVNGVRTIEWTPPGSWPHHISLPTGVGVSLVAWWTIGPPLIWGTSRAVGRGIWPLRLAWRYGQRWAYRRQLTEGIRPAEWPERPEPGQRWHETPTAIRDRRRPGRQAADTESARKAAERELIRRERIEGRDVGPAPLWRWVYRVFNVEVAGTQGAPKNSKVSPWSG